MALWVVARTGGSKWVQAPLTDSGQTSVGVWGSAKRSGASPSRGRQRRHVFSGESRKTGEFGDFNLWSPNSCSVRRQQVAVGPADRQQVEPGTARPTDKNNSGYKRIGLILGARVAIIETNPEIKECTNYASCYYQGDVREGL